MKKTVEYNINKVDVKLNIECEDNITCEMIEASKDIISKGQLHFLEVDYKGMIACDTHLYNTCYDMININVNPTYNEHDEVIACEFNFELKKSGNQVHLFNKKNYKSEEALLNAISN